jgi:hypothetical protein
VRGGAGCQDHDAPAAAVIRTRANVFTTAAFLRDPGLLLTMGQLD